VNSVCILRNNIVWNNNLIQPGQAEITDNKHQEFGGFDTSQLLLRNCIVKNGNQLTFFNSSNFSVDPKFVDAAQRNFALRWDNYPNSDASRSIAIDNGYHLSPFDDDSTRRDIGAISFFRVERRNHTWVRFSMDTTLGYLSNHTVNFLNLSHIGIFPTTWLWDFGDGSTSNVSNPTHTYTQTGVFSVKLKAMDTDGHTDSLLLPNVITVLAGRRINPGAVSGVWDKEYNPYYVYGDIFVPNGQKLEINHGVEIRFMGSYSFDVYGSLIANGASNDTVVFRANDTTGMGLYKNINIDYPFADFQRNKGWVGIHFISNSSDPDTCFMKYCKITNVRIGRPSTQQYKGTLKLHKIKTAIVRNCLFIDNFTTPQNYIFADTIPYQYQTAGIAAVGTNAIIENNKFENQYMFGPAAVYATQADSLRLTGNHFFNITNKASAVEGIKRYVISDNIYDSIAGLCLRLTDPYWDTATVKLNEVNSNLFSNSKKCIQGPGIYKIRFSKNLFKNNLSEIDVCMEVWGSKIHISNNLFYNNRVTGTLGNVGAVCINLLLEADKTAVIANNVLIDNYGTFYQSIIYGDDSIKLYNNIVRNQGGVEMQATVFTTSWFFSNFTKSYHNNVKGGYSHGVNNYDQPPQFVDSLNHDYRLKKTSTSINRGYQDTTGLKLTSTDYYSNLRIDTFLNKIDVGIFEYFTKRPVAISLSKDSIKENLPVLTVIGELSSSDPDITDTHTYSLINIQGVPNNNSDFVIQNDSLQSNVIFNLSQNPRRVSIRSTDQFGAYYDTTFTVHITSNPIITSVTDINELRKIILIYPIPFRNEIVLDPKNTYPGKWQIRTITGAEVKKGVFQNRTILNLSSLSAGVYILEITDKNKTYSIKVTKQ
jgi:PKD repeat protein